MSKRSKNIKSPERLRGMLKGLKWTAFIRNQRSTCLRNRIPFYGRCGLHMGRSVVVIIAQGQFIAIKKADISTKYIGMVMLDPNNSTPNGIPLSQLTNRIPVNELLDWWREPILGPDNG